MHFSSFFKPKIRGLYKRAVTDQERVIVARVRYAKRDGKEAVNSFSKVLATEAPGITLNSREVFRIDPLLPIEGPESSSILDIRLLEWMFDKLKM